MNGVLVSTLKKRIVLGKAIILATESATCDLGVRAMDLALPPDLPDPPGEDSVKETLGVDAIRTGLDRAEERKKEESWVKVAEDKRSLKKHNVEVLKKDGIQTVEIPDEIIENSTPLWGDFLVGKFLDLAPHIAKVHKVLNRIWKYGDDSTKVDVYDVNATTMRFRVSSSKAREKIIRRGMWNIAGVPMVVTKWTPTTEGEKQEDEAIPMWVHLEKVPIHMYSWEGLSFITSPIGFPVKLHQETIACTNLKEAKVFAKVDTSKVLPKEITFTKGGEEFTVKYFYPWLPLRCNRCEKWGHGEKVCELKRTEEKMNGSPVAKSPGIVNKKKEEGSVMGVKQGEKGSAMEDSNEDKSRTEERLENAWSGVSPGRIGRSQRVQNNGIEIQISASKFSVLNVEEEEGEILEDNLKEGEVSQEEDRDVDVIHDSEEEFSRELTVSERGKVGGLRGRKKGQKTKAQDPIPGKSMRSSRRKN
ncbi:uncharacterized protein LOC103863864 [Brassica rapa]|uniref:uncharacterized protein LOC103863864 n=1 Tax=Brassica campestris TaxID=3711 RepID=UPI0004F1AC4C|nr:uncharacterized protein LOC103863864 [Brassica rapa]